MKATLMKYELINGTKVMQAYDNGRFVLRAGLMFDGLSKTAVPNVDIEVENGRIKAIGPCGSFSTANLNLLDCSDKFVMPGLIEAHVHLSGMKTPDAYRRYFEKLEIRLIRAMRHAEELLSRGYTSVRDLGGNSCGVSLREAIGLGMMRGPLIQSAVEYLSPTAGHGDWPVLPYDFVKSTNMRSMMVDGVDECVRGIRQLVREKADLIKIVVASGSMGQPYGAMKFKNNFSMAEIRAMADEAHDQSRPIAAHTVGNNGVRRALEGGIDTLEHCFFNFEKEPELIDLMLEKKVFVIPTISILQWSGETEEKKGDSALAKGFYDNIERHGAFVKAAFEAGVPIACGTDETGTRGTGRCAEEYGRLVKAGLPTYGVLWGATGVAARVMRIESQTGSLVPGKKADILVLKGNPLENITDLENKENICCVIQGK